MKNERSLIHRLESVAQVHEALGLPAPLHPLISLISNAGSPLRIPPAAAATNALGFYKISYKTAKSGRLRYGQASYTAEKGGLMFIAPNQTLGPDAVAAISQPSLYSLIVHPDFLRASALDGTIKSYGFFSYEANETLPLPEPEAETVRSLFRMIESELRHTGEAFSAAVVLSQIELLLHYADRLYKRRRPPAEAAPRDLLSRLEALLDGHFGAEAPSGRGFLTVQSLADGLALSPGYLSELLRSLTGQNAQQHIHRALIEKAKEKLAATNLSVGEIAYGLGFDYPQSFSTLFKSKTGISPLAYRRSFR